jgi:hypothetical protein
MVKEPMMGFISLIGKKPNFSQWIGSILQAIKDRSIKDCYVRQFYP